MSSSSDAVQAANLRKLHSIHKSLQLSSLPAFNHVTSVQSLVETLTKTTSPSLALAIIKQLVKLVQKGKLPWVDCQREFLTLLRTVPDNLVQAVVTGLGDLLFLHLQSALASLKNGERYEAPFTIGSPRPHPFSSAIQIRKECWKDIVCETERILSRVQNEQDLIESEGVGVELMQSFVRFVFLDPSPQRIGFPQQYLLETMVEFVVSRENIADMLDLVELLMSVLQDLPIVRVDDVDTLHLVNVIVDGILSRSYNQEIWKNETASLLNVGLTILAMICQWNYLGLSTAPLLKSFLTYYDLFVQTQSMDSDKRDAVELIAMTVFGYTLLNCVDIDEEGKRILEFFNKIMRLDSTPLSKTRCVIARLFIWPVLEVVLNVNDGKSVVRKQASELLERLTAALLVGENKDENDDGVNSLLEIFFDLPAKYSTHLFGTLVTYLKLHLHQYLVGPSSSSALFETPLSDSPNLKAYFTTASLFSLNASRQTWALEYLSKQTSYGETGALGFSLIPVLLYAQKFSSQPAFQFNLLTKTFPELTVCSDPYVIVRVTKILVGMVDNTAPALFVVGLLGMTELWKRQSRVWVQLRHVLASWIKTRKIVLSAPPLTQDEATRKSTEEIDEAISRTMYTLVSTQDRIREVGEDLAPLTLGLLTTTHCLEHFSGIVLLNFLRIVCKCIEGNFAETRAVWNVVMERFVKSLLAKKGGAELDPLVWEGVCEYWRIAGSKYEETELYIQFRQSILTTYIIPFLSHSNPEIRRLTYTALSHFPPSEITPLILSPQEFVSTFKDVSNTGISNLLVRLVTYESENMRRAVWKGLSGANSLSLASSRKTYEAGVSAFEALKRVARDIGYQVHDLWETGKCSAGLRSGYAVATLCGPLSLSISATKDNANKISPALSKFLSKALSDASYSDHVLLRLSAISFWTTFWEQTFGYYLKESIEVRQNLVTLLIEDLLTKFEDAKVPGTAVNALFAVTAIIPALSVLSLPPTSFTTHILNGLLPFTRSSVKANREYLDAHMSDEVQSALCLTLAKLANSVKGEEDIVFTVMKILEMEIANIDFEVTPVCAVFGYTSLVGSLLYSSSSKAYLPNIFTCANNYLTTLVNPIVRSAFAMCCGPLFEVYHDVDSRCQTMVKIWFAEAKKSLKSMDLTNCETASWILVNGLSAVANGGVMDTWLKKEAADIDVILKTCLDELLTKKQHDSLSATVLLNYSTALNHYFVNSLESDQPMSTTVTIATITSHVGDLFTRFNTPSTSPVLKTSCLLSIATTLGIGFGLSATNPIAFAIHELANGMKQILYNLSDVMKSSSDVRSGRIAAIIAALFASECVDEGSLKKSQKRNKKSGGSGVVKKELPNFARLDLENSWVRAVWDGLERGLESESVELVRTLFNVFHETRYKLPLVDWSPKLSAISQFSTSDRMKSLEFVAKHCQKNMSLSMIDFLVSNVALAFTNIVPMGWSFENAQAVRVWAVSEDGLGCILSLGGLGGNLDFAAAGEDDSSAEAAVPNSRLLEIVRAMVYYLWSTAYGDERTLKGLMKLQVEALNTLSRHLLGVTSSTSSTSRGTSNDLPIAAISEMISMASRLRREVLQVLLNVYETLPDPNTPDSCSVLTAIVTPLICHEETFRAFIQQECSTQQSGFVWSRKTIVVVLRFVEMVTLPRFANLLGSTQMRILQSGLKDIGDVVNVMIKVFKDTLLLFRYDGLLVKTLLILRRALNVLMAQIADSVSGRKEDVAMEWLIRILDIIIVVSSQSMLSNERGIGSNTWDLGMEALLSTFVSDCWAQPQKGRKDESIDVSTTMFPAKTMDGKWRECFVRDFTRVLPNVLKNALIGRKRASDVVAQVYRRLLRLYIVGQQQQQHLISDGGGDMEEDTNGYEDENSGVAAAVFALRAILQGLRCELDPSHSQETWAKVVSF